MNILNPQPGQIVVDATVNGGGHARAIAERVGAAGKVIGIDWDCDLVEQLQRSNRELGIANMEAVCDSYANINAIISERKIASVNNILFDLGFSSHHIERSGRGFSFQRDEPLDMRYNAKTNELTAEKIINAWSGDAIAALLRDCGEERFARRIAERIVRARVQRRITRTSELVSIIERALPRAALNKRLHPATRAFQALRIAVNDELANLKKGLEAGFGVLAPGGRIAVIAFHSLEDRIVKQFFAQMMKSGAANVLTRTPLRPARSETIHNPRARSARLRAAEKIQGHP